MQEMDPNYDYEDPASSWLDLVAACRDPDVKRRGERVQELLNVAKNSHWTHSLWDRVMRDLETPDVESDDASDLNEMSRGYGPGGARTFQKEAAGYNSDRGREVIHSAQLVVLDESGDEDEPERKMNARGYY